MFEFFPLSEDRVVKINQSLRDKDVQLKIYVTLIDLLTSKEPNSEFETVKTHAKARQLASLLKEAQQKQK